MDPTREHALDEELSLPDDALLDPDFETWGCDASEHYGRAAWLRHARAPADVDELERQFLAELHDPAARSVYGDWLEACGRTACARYLSIQELVRRGGPYRVPDVRRGLVDLAADTPAWWRRAVALAPVAAVASLETAYPLLASAIESTTLREALDWWTDELPALEPGPRAGYDHSAFISKFPDRPRLAGNVRRSLHHTPRWSVILNVVETDDHYALGLWWTTV